MGLLKSSDYIQIKIKMPNPSQEPPASSKASNDNSKNMDVLCTFKIKIECPNLDHGYIKDQWPYPNWDQDAKPQSGTSSILQSPKLWLKGHGCSLHPKTHDRVEIQNMGLSRTKINIQIKIKMPNPNQAPPVSSKAIHEYLKNTDVVRTSKIKIESQNLDHGYVKYQW